MHLYKKICLKKLNLSSLNNRYLFYIKLQTLYNSKRKTSYFIKEIETKYAFYSMKLYYKVTIYNYTYTTINM